MTTDASCGAVNSMHDSYTPLGGLVPMFNMQTDEVIFGGVGSGLYGMLLYAIMGVFIAGLMVGRTPEYIGKKIQQKEVKMALFAILATSFLILVFSGISIVAPFAKGATGTPGRGDRESEQRRPARVERDAVRLHERDGEQRQRVRRHHRQHAVVRPDPRPRHAVRPLPLHDPRAGDCGQPRRQEGGSDLGRHAAHARPLFVGLLVATVIVIGALTFFPALSLGPIVEHFLMHQGRLFSTMFVSFPVWS